ncbi:Response regulator PleD [Fundidesulfovibrio magnetotacticus]|uniref:diguanylate cyclase n=1 Tax=Fundidesulfovibrio magnetotacticus TaxID=2730080 RepID=A0A6V8LJF7_9BACT|nr:diguanylate cyclase [Fundidesulfovibrio magnetotacticus]GFK92872.1 Response regulator PleD [Fundidesulfovibrio magnetotacticus]
MEEILLVEDSRTFGSLLRRTVEREVGRTVTWVKSRAECEAALAENPHGFAAALLDLNLPDAHEGEVVDVVLAYNVPAVVFTGEMAPGLREAMWEKGIVDYVFKQGLHTLDYVVRLLRRILRNKGLRAVAALADDAERARLTRLLTAHGYQAIPCADARTALETARADASVRLVLTDSILPDATGAELTRSVRETRGLRDVAVIGMAAEHDGEASAALLKSGANDFITRPFMTEEFYCRISQNVDMLNLLDDFADLANRDVLTGLGNRTHLFDAGNRLFTTLRREDRGLAAALIGVDRLKEVNDTHGHDAGDTVLRHVAVLLRQHFRGSDILARLAGDEFCVLDAEMTPEQALDAFDAFRADVAAGPAQYGGLQITVSVSIGLQCAEMASFDALIRSATALLDKAEETGGDQVLLNTDPIGLHLSA